MNVEQSDQPGKYRVSRIQTISNWVVDLDKTKWTNDEPRETDFLQEGDVLLSHINSIEHLAKSAIFTGIGERVVHGINLIKFRPKRDLVDAKYLHFVMRSEKFVDRAKTFAQKAVNQASIKLSDLKSMQIPLPPLEEQERIVAELEGYRKVIEGARQVIAHYKPTIRIDPKWSMVKLGEVCTSILSGGTPSTQIAEYWKGNIPWITSADIIGLKEVKPRKFITEEAIRASATNLIPANNVIVVTRVGLGKLLVNSIDLCISQDSQGLLVDRHIVDPTYLGYVLSEMVLLFKTASRGSTIQGVTKSQLIELEIPLPPLDIQRRIVAELEAERKLVEANRDLIARMEAKIQAKLAEVWGKEENMVLP